eukprot:m.82709 g.82709  ORF g.82709 m.82709 type:complete len:214 (+) comp11128_c0_seq2:397-1038(+)
MKRNVPARPVVVFVDPEKFGVTYITFQVQNGQPPPVISVQRHHFSGAHSECLKRSAFKLGELKPRFNRHFDHFCLNADEEAVGWADGQEVVVSKYGQRVRIVGTSRPSRGFDTKEKIHPPCHLPKMAETSVTVTNGAQCGHALYQMLATQSGVLKMTTISTQTHYRSGPQPELESPSSPDRHPCRTGCGLSLATAGHPDRCWSRATTCLSGVG